MGKITAPDVLTDVHDTSFFCSGVTTLDDWLKKRALKNQKNGASRTFVICDTEQQVVGYYALATGSVERIIAPKSFSRNMPEPIPVIVLARLAIDKKFQNHGLGAGLLKDTMFRTLSIAKNVGVRGLLVHAISDQAKQFYLNYGFQGTLNESMTLLLSIKNIRMHLDI